MEKIKSKLEYLHEFRLSESESSDLLTLINGYNNLLGSISVDLLGLQRPPIHHVFIRHREQKIQKVHTIG